MKLAFWRPRERFSLEELRYLTGQLQKIYTVDNTNKEYVIEILRSMAELVTYGDQHDPTFFEFFMEKQIMGEFVRILKVSRTATVALQLLQTVSIMIQNLKSEHAIYYIFSNEHINHLIKYSFDFSNEELLSYYISFLRAISGKLNKNTISLLVKTQDEEVVSFPLYTESIRFAFHEESMVRIAVRALTLNVYHVGDSSVNKFVTSAPLSIYFSDLVSHFKQQCFNLDSRVSEVSKNPDFSDTTSIFSAVEEIEDTLYYFSDVISSGVPNLGRLIVDNILKLLVFPVLLPSVQKKRSDGQSRVGIAASLYLICCILRIVKTKDLASIITASVFFPPEAFTTKSSQSKPNGYVSEHAPPHQRLDSLGIHGSAGGLRVSVLSSSQIHPAADVLLQNEDSLSNVALRDILLSYVICGDDIQALGSLAVLSTLLQTKELDESMLDALGILPQRKQHKKLLLQALVGESSGEEQLFSSESCMEENSIIDEPGRFFHKLEGEYGWWFPCSRNMRMSPRINRYQVLDALVSLLCRLDLFAETLWAGGWLLRQLLPYCKEEFSDRHLKLLKESYKNRSNCLIRETRGSWCDLLVPNIVDEWKKCKRAIEASSPQKDPKCILVPSFGVSSEGQSSIAGKQMLEIIKVYVLCHQIQIFSVGETLPEEAPVHYSVDPLVNSRATVAGLESHIIKPGIEVNLVNAVPCRIAFERGKERHFSFLAVSRETSGWILLSEELPLKQNFGIVRVMAPLAGSNPKVDEKHRKWLHLRIRPWNLPLKDSSKSDMHGRSKGKALVDGRWTLAFRDEQSCESAESMVLEEMNLQCDSVEKRLKPLLDAVSCVNTP